jgi:hypothetical protein
MCHVQVLYVFAGYMGGTVYTDGSDGTVTSEETQRYSDIIDSILADANLETISRKAVVKELEERIGQSTSEHKVPLNP